MMISWLVSFTVVFAALLLAVFIATRYRTAKAERALIITGAKVQEGIKVLRAGGTFVWPIIQHAEYLSLQVHTLEVHTPEVYTTDGIPVIVDAIAQIKVRGDVESIAVAAEHYLGKPVEAVGYVAMQSFEGNLRAILAKMTVDAVYKHRDEFANNVREVAENDLNKTGLQVVTFTIRDVKDTMGYLDALGLPQIAALKRDAEISKANALRDEQMAKSKALEDSQKAEFLAETNIAEAAKEMEVKKTAFRLECEMRNAEAKQSIKLQEIKMLYNVKQEEMTTQIMEKQKLNELEAKELERRERLDASMKRSAEALNNAKEQQAEPEVIKGIATTEAAKDKMAKAPNKHGDKAASGRIIVDLKN